MAATQLRAVIVDHQRLCRDGLRHVLDVQCGIHVAGEGATCSDVRRLVGEHEPDVAIVEYEYPDGTIVDVLAEIVGRGATRVLVVTAHASVDDAKVVLREGAAAYLLKTEPLAHLLEALAAARDGGRYLAPGLGAQIVSGGSRNRFGFDVLTRREMQVAVLIALGHTSREIADLWSNSTRTIESHRAKVMSKLGVRTRSELVRWALDQRLIGPSAA